MTRDYNSKFLGQVNEGEEDEVEGQSQTDL